MTDASPTSVRKVLARTLLSIGLIGACASAQAETIIGLNSGNGIFTFDSATPGVTSASIAVTGLAAGSTLIGIDLRPSTGVLYGAGNDGTIYTINTATGAATIVGSVSGGIPAGHGIGIDFNPVPDLAGNASLRITTFASNVRFNVNMGSVATANDTNINGATTFLDAVAYTNNDRDATTGTALYGITGGSLYQVTTPNAGTTVLIGALGVSSLDGATGFDVSGISGTSFASLTSANGVSGFYTINLSTGAATLVGAIGAVGAAFGIVRDITAATQAPFVSAVPEPETYAMLMAGLASLGWAARRRRR